MSVGSLIEQELRSQPEVWTSVASSFPAVRGSLPAAHERVVATGCGSSANVAAAYAHRREAAGLGISDAVIATDHDRVFRRERCYDRCIVITRSGRTTEVLRLLARLRADPLRPQVTVITSQEREAVSDESVITLGAATEQSVVSTRFTTSALVLLVTSLGVETTETRAAAAKAMNEPLPRSRATHWVFLGEGWAAPLACEASLKVTEASGASASWYPATEYRHGPIAAATSSTMVYAIGPLPHGLAADIERTGAHVIDTTGDPLVDLVRVQRLAVALARERGWDPDRPPHLRYAVTL